MYQKIDHSAWDLLWEKVEPHLANSPHHPEIEEFKLLPGLLRNVRSFVDAGASYGPYSWLAIFTLSGAEITAIEGNPQLCNHLRSEWDEISKAGQANGNSFTVINAPLSNKSELVVFNVNQADFFTSSIAGVSDVSTSNATTQNVRVKAVTLDELFHDKPPDLIKIDIEGAEWRAIDGARSLLKQRKSTFLVEIHPWGDAGVNKKPSHVFSIFREFRYTVVRLNHHWLFFPQSPTLSNSLLSRLYGFASNSLFLRKLATAILGGRGKKA